MTKSIDELTKKMKKLSTTMTKTLKELDEDIQKTKLKIRNGKVKKRPGLSLIKHQNHLHSLLKQRTQYMKSKKDLSSKVTAMNNLVANMKALKH